MCREIKETGALDWPEMEVARMLELSANLNLHFNTREEQTRNRLISDVEAKLSPDDHLPVKDMPKLLEDLLAALEKNAVARGLVKEAGVANAQPVYEGHSEPRVHGSTTSSGASSAEPNANIQEKDVSNPQTPIAHGPESTLLTRGALLSRTLSLKQVVSSAAPQGIPRETLKTPQ